jgi:hypothetical protein
MVTDTRTRGSLVLLPEVNRKSQRSAGSSRIDTGERTNDALVVWATSFVRSRRAGGNGPDR